MIFVIKAYKAIIIGKVNYRAKGKWSLSFILRNKGVYNVFMSDLLAIYI